MKPAHPEVYAVRVAPFTGAWIEIEVLKAGTSLSQVAPFTGAWIEILFVNL